MGWIRLRRDGLLYVFVNVVDIRPCWCLSLLVFVIVVAVVFVCFFRFSCVCVFFFFVLSMDFLCHFCVYHVMPLGVLRFISRSFFMSFVPFFVGSFFVFALCFMVLVYYVISKARFWRARVKICQHMYEAAETDLQKAVEEEEEDCLLYTSPSPRD